MGKKAKSLIFLGIIGFVCISYSCKQRNVCSKISSLSTMSELSADYGVFLGAFIDSIKSTVSENLVYFEEEYFYSCNDTLIFSFWTQSTPNIRGIEIYAPHLKVVDDIHIGLSYSNLPEKYKELEVKYYEDVEGYYIDIAMINGFDYAFMLKLGSDNAEQISKKNSLDMWNDLDYYVEEIRLYYP